MTDVLLPGLSWLAVAGIATVLALGAAAHSRTAKARARVRQIRPTLIGGRAGRRLERWCAAADLTTAADRWLRTTVVAAVAVAPVAAAIDLRLVPVGIGAVVGGRFAHLMQRIRTRPDRVAQNFPEVLDAVAAELRAGASLTQAVLGQAEAATPGAEILAPLRRRLELGAGIPEALQVWLLDGPTADVRVLIAALQVAAERGGQVAPALERIAAASRDRRQVAEELRVQTTQARLSAIIVAAAPIGFLLVTVAVDTAAADRLFATGAGRTCLALGLVCNAAAVACIGWMLRDPLRRRARRSSTRDRQARLAAEREAPVAADLLALALGTGATPVEAVGVVARWGPDAIASPFRSVAQLLDLGSSFAQAAGELATVHPPLAPMARALLAAFHGAPVQDLVVRLADDARQAMRRAGELRARRTPVLLLFPLVFLVLPAFVLLSVAPALLAGLSSL